MKLSSLLTPPSLNPTWLKFGEYNRMAVRATLNETVTLRLSLCNELQGSLAPATAMGAVETCYLNYRL
jgi:hypothetical protein